MPDSPNRICILQKIENLWRHRSPAPESSAPTCQIKLNHRDTEAQSSSQLPNQAGSIEKVEILGTNSEFAARFHSVPLCLGGSISWSDGQPAMESAFSKN